MLGAARCCLLIDPSRTLANKFNYRLLWQMRQPSNKSVAVLPASFKSGPCGKITAFGVDFRSGDVLVLQQIDGQPQFLKIKQFLPDKHEPHVLTKLLVAGQECKTVGYDEFMLSWIVSVTDIERIITFPQSTEHPPVKARSSPTWRKLDSSQYYIRLHFDL